MWYLALYVRNKLHISVDLVGIPDAESVFLEYVLSVVGFKSFTSFSPQFNKIFGIILSKACCLVLWGN